MAYYMSEVTVTVVTATTGRKELARCIKSVEEQTFQGQIQHLIFADGPDASDRVQAIRDEVPFIFGEVVDLPYPTGKDRWNGHRMYGAGCYLAEGQYIMFLDDDNTIDPDHIQSCYELIKGKPNNLWSYSLRKIVTVDGQFLCNDDCESLGNWASVIHPNDYFIDVNCYFLPRNIAVTISPAWYRKFREPGQPEVDRVLHHVLRTQISQGFCTGKYTVNYAVASNASLSVKPEFFINGNTEMNRRFNGELPWRKK